MDFDKPDAHTRPDVTVRHTTRTTFSFVFNRPIFRILRANKFGRDLKILQSKTFGVFISTKSSNSQIIIR